MTLRSSITSERELAKVSASVRSLTSVYGESCASAALELETAAAEMEGLQVSECSYALRSIDLSSLYAVVAYSSSEVAGCALEWLHRVSWKCIAPVSHEILRGPDFWMCRPV